VEREIRWENGLSILIHNWWENINSRKVGEKEIERKVVGSKSRGYGLKRPRSPIVKPS